MPPLSDDQIVWISALPRKLNATRAAEIVGCSQYTVLSIWKGRHGGERLASLRGETYCTSCQHFATSKGECTYHFPEFDLCGPAFARDCALYKREDLQQPLPLVGDASA
jgi:hypothetical protein